MIDKIFTPNHLANELVQYYSRSTHPQLITDFAVGEGSLIKAAYKHWPESQYIVNDIDQNVLSKINLPSSNIEFLNYDFLESDFENTIADYLTFEFNMVSHNRDYLFNKEND